METTKLLSIPEVATATGLRYRRVYEAVRSGEIPHVKIRNRRLIDQRFLTAWLQRANPQGVSVRQPSK